MLSLCEIYFLICESLRRFQCYISKLSSSSGMSLFSICVKQHRLFTVTLRFNFQTEINSLKTHRSLVVCLFVSLFLFIPFQASGFLLISTPSMIKDHRKSFSYFLKKTSVFLKFDKKRNLRLQWQILSFCGTKRTR